LSRICDLCVLTVLMTHAPSMAHTTMFVAEPPCGAGLRVGHSVLAGWPGTVDLRQRQRDRAAARVHTRSVIMRCSLLTGRAMLIAQQTGALEAGPASEQQRESMRDAALCLVRKALCSDPRCG
jgi:hypothetical protein